MYQSQHNDREIQMKKPKNPISMQEFIEGAEGHRNAKKARRRVSTENILLSAAGRTEARKGYSKLLIYLSPDIEEDMEKYCSGTKQAIISYLIRRGLDELIKENKVVIYETN